MPMITLHHTGKSDAALSSRLAEQVTELTRVHLKKDPAVTAVAVLAVDPAHWFIGRRSLAEQNLASFWLDIKVTDATNTKAEMARYITAVFTGISGTLGPIHSESYVLVHEVPAAAYGFGGQTQEFRFIYGRMQPSV
jgi:4-oxalocrotonate tautomerase